MERGTKRKAASLAAPATPQTPASDRPAKRVRTPLVAEAKSKPTANLQEQARDFVDHLKRATDKNGRLICTAFLELPDPDDLPDYYDLIYLPISIETLESKIERNEYASLSELEADVKRMVANAKKYNESRSEVYDDAERIRKLTFNYMTRLNPAYKGGNYTAVATAEPETPQGYPGRAGTTKIKLGQKIKAASSSSDTPKPREPSRSQSVAATATPGPAADDTEFAGKTMQQAQDMILREAMAYTADELEIFTPFINLPSRSLTEYYAIIKNPTSLKGTLKKVHGIKGRNETTGVTEFKSWDSFETEVSRIWTNARTFNEDGSDMYNLANTFEQWFRARLAEAKAAVPEPNAPTLKLNLNKSNATNIKLRLGQREGPATPSTAQDASPAPQTNGVTVDQEALQRQKAHVYAGINGQAVPRPASSSSQGPDAKQIPTPLPASAAVKPGVNGVNGTASPAMPPPTVPVARPGSGSPFPPQQGANGMLSQQQQQFKAYQAYTQPPAGIESKWRSEGKGPEDSLLAQLRVSSNQTPNANTLPNGLSMPADNKPSKALQVSIPAHPRLAQQSVTLSIPISQAHLILHPKLHPTLHAGRAYRIFVTLNGARVSQSPNLEHRLQYEVRCLPGVNRVEVEVVAAKVASSNKVSGLDEGDAPAVAGAEAGDSATPTDGQEPPPQQQSSQQQQQQHQPQQLEVERISLFVHVLRG